MFKIDKNVELPNSNKKYPFDDMDVGDSFLISGETIGSNVKSAIQHFKKVEKYKKFQTRTVNEGVRVWRIA